MGYMRHHAIVVTSWNEEKPFKAHTKATEILRQVAPITPPAVNGYVSFLIAPDGSKEGWSESNKGDDARGEFVAWLDEQKFGDGSTSLPWVEIQLADDEEETKIVSHSDQ